LANRVLEALTPTTITSLKRLQAELAAIRRSGFGVSRGETVSGLGTIGVPVFGAGERPIAVLGLAFPEHAVTARSRGDLVQALHRSARVLSQRLGSQVYPFGMSEKAAGGSNAAAG
jgi:DNA-binding IclR family transcriptional regulator